MLKFSKIDNKSELLDTLIKEEDARRASAPINSTFDPLTLTECPRRLLYRIVGVSHSDLMSYLDRQHLLAIKDKWLHIFEDCRKVQLMQEKVSVADAKYNITGQIDVIISFGSDIYATQIKSVCSDDFIKIKQKGAPKKDVVELVVYLWLLEEKDGLIIYNNNNNGDYIIFHIEPYQPIIKSIRSKCHELMRHKMEGSLPERPYKDSSSSECGLCEFVKMCWKQKREIKL